MATFKDVSVYYEVAGNWLDACHAAGSPFRPHEILRMTDWKFKGGSMVDAAGGGSVEVVNSGAVWPDGMSRQIGAHISAVERAGGVRSERTRELAASFTQRDIFRKYMVDRLVSRGRKPDGAAMCALAATYAAVVSSITNPKRAVLGFSPMIQGAAAIYSAADIIVSTSKVSNVKFSFEAGSGLRDFIREVVVCSALGSSLHAPTAEEVCEIVCKLLAQSRVAAVMSAWRKVTAMIADMTRKSHKAATLIFGKRVLSEEPVVMRRLIAEEKERNPGAAGWELRDIVESQGSIFVEPEVVRLAKSWTTRNTSEFDVTDDLVFNVSQMVAWARVDGNRILVFGKSSLTSLAQTLISYCSQLVATTADAVIESRAFTRTPVARAQRVMEGMAGILHDIYSCGAACSPGEHVRVCKSYKRAFSVYHAKLAGPCASADVPILMNAALEVGEVPEDRLMHYLSFLGTLTAQEAHNVGRCFKVCPPPDVSPGATMLDRIRDIKNPNVYSSRYGDVVMAELETQIVFARCRMPGALPTLKPGVQRPRWWSSYLRRDWANVPVDDLPATVEWEASVELPVRSRLDPSVWKDSSVGADSLAEGLNNTFPRKNKNMKTRMLYDPDVPMPDAGLRPREDVIEMLIKGEGHKDPARAIFSSNMTHRFLQGNLELAVEQVAAHHPSFIIGDSPQALETLQRLLTDASSPNIAYVRYYSFDVSGWSAKMSREVQEKSRAIWDKLYGTKVFTSSLTHMADADVYVNKSGYIGWYRNTGSNLEGFDGKHLTMVNVAMLAASVKVWRQRAVAANLCSQVEADRVSALLLSYIDDGMARLDFPATGGQDQSERCFRLFQEVCKDVFGDASFTLDPPKCFPSEVFFVFLNEVFVTGRSVVYGARAASTICGEPMEEFLALPECMEKIANGCRGVCKAGGDPVAVSILQAFHSYYLLAAWVNLDSTVPLARWCVIPRAMGGLGMPTALQMGSTASGEPLAEGISTLQAMSSCTSYDLTLLSMLLNAEYEESSTTSILVAPLSIRIKEGYMSTAAVSVAVRRAIEEYASEGKPMSSVAYQYMSYADADALQDYADIIVPAESVVQEVYLDAAAESHPQKVFAEFARSIESARTLRNIITDRVYNDILRTNRAQAKASWTKLKLRIAMAAVTFGERTTSGKLI